MALCDGTSSRVRVATIAIIGVIVMLTGGGCGSALRPGPASGNVQTQTRDVRGFDAVEFAGAGQLTVQQGGTESLQISADEDVLSDLTSEMIGTTLRLGVRDGTSIPDNAKISYSVTAKTVKQLALSGAGDVTVTGVDGAELSVTHGGAGRITTSGRVTRTAVYLTGVGSYDGRNLAAQDADVTLSGTGEAVVNAAGTLQAHLTGIGSIRYVGDPEVTQDDRGVGQITRL